MLAASLIKDPRGRQGVTPGGCAQLAQTIQTGAGWMIERGMTDFTGMDSEASWDLLRYFLETHEDPTYSVGFRPREISFSSASHRLRFVSLIYDQRKSLERYGIAVPNEAPFDGRSINDVVNQDLNLFHGPKQEPIPDNVFLAMVNGAIRILGDPAEDVIELQMLCCPQLHRPIDTSDRASELTFYAEANAEAEAFIFSTINGESEPWATLNLPQKRALIDGRETNVDGRQLIRRLILSIQAACITIIQSCGGLRVNTLCSLEDSSFTGDFPSCLSVRKSLDGLIDLFYVVSPDHKVSHEDKEWLIGASPCGSEFVPPTVRALSVLHRLSAPWRQLSERSSLIVSFSSARGLPRKKDSIGTMTATTITDAERYFLREWCDVSGLTSDEMRLYVHGKGLRDQKWKTTFAIYMTRVDGRLLAAVSQHFRHLRAATTDKFYVGRDLRHMGLTASAAYRESAKFFRDVLEGGEPIVGRFERILRDFPVKRGSSQADYEIAVIRLDLRILPFDYGFCGIAANPEEARCHKLGGTEAWYRRSPNHSFRGVTTCAGCRCFGASKANLPFWMKRETDLDRLINNDARIQDGTESLLKLRLQQARAMVRGLTRDRGSCDDKQD
jgi:hypothetical protein